GCRDRWSPNRQRPTWRIGDPAPSSLPGAKRSCFSFLVSCFSFSPLIIVRGNQKPETRNQKLETRNSLQVGAVSFQLNICPTREYLPNAPWAGGPPKNYGHQTMRTKSGITVSKNPSADLRPA